jgi:capsular exopolysaccharide synthesis family protein
VRTNIDFIFSAQKPVTILITSSIAGEGKSFCAANLAAVYSACGKRTIIVGCDMHKPYTFDGFEVSNSSGLSDFLNGRVQEVKDIIRKTVHMNLDVLVPGPVPANPAELLISDRFHHLLHDLQQRYDIIVLDSSPVGLTNETLYLTRMADLTVFVLRQKYSDKTFLDDINALKEKKGIKNLYALINDVEDEHLSYGGYGYGYYEETEVKENAFRKMIRMISNKAAI